jgi:death-on-curing protein
MRYLKKSFIVFINKKSIDRHGGQFIQPYNLLRDESLDFLVESVQESVFGQELYPGIHDKAAVYMHSIIGNHIFSDGNKRTGLESALLFLELNNYKLNPDLTDDDLYNFTIKVAEGKMTLDEVRAWFRSHITKK